MAKVQITKTQKGWIDNDDPSTTYPSRRAARDGRRQALIAKGKTAHLRSLKAKPTTAKPDPGTGVSTSNVTTSPNDGSLLTSLQQRLLDRMTQRQGVNLNEALQVISVNPYNKAASYGHMRAAGANHAEAVIVINLGNPDVSVSYGKARAAGYNHTYALQRALREAQDDAADD